MTSVKTYYRYIIKYYLFFNCTLSQGLAGQKKKNFNVVKKYIFTNNFKQKTKQYVIHIKLILFNKFWE